MAAADPAPCPGSAEEPSVTETDLTADSEQVRGLYRERAHLMAPLVRVSVLDQGREAVIA